MARETVHPDIVTHRRWSIFPEDVQAALKALGNGLRKRRIDEAALDTSLKAFEELSAQHIVQASAEIQELSHFYVFSDSGWKSRLERAMDGYSNLDHVSRFVTHEPKLARLLMFHCNGYVRQMALEAFKDPPQNGFEFAALVYRMNDWVPQVREAAASAFARTTDCVPAAAISGGLISLLPRTQEFRRWSERERERFKACIEQPDVTRDIHRMMMGRPNGRIGAYFRLVLRNPLMDKHLPDFASKASFPLVRATAFEALITRRTRWFVGQDWQWIDKRHGLKRRTPRHDSRPVQHDLDLVALIRQGAADRSVIVRKTVARAMVEARADLPDDVWESAKALAKDTSAAVRLHAEFFLKNVSGPGTSRHRD